MADNPDLIHVGTVLTLPPTTPRASHTYTVKAGDTLSGIAQRELGDATQYPAIFEASRHTLQPGGVHLVDPDQIDIGQTLTIPSVAPASPPAESSTTPPVAAPAAPATPATPPVTARPVTHPDPGPAEPGSASPIPSGAAQTAPRSTDSVDATDQASSVAPWLLTGLTGGGALLAGSMLMLLRRRRRAQFRNRRPGHTLAAPAPILGPVEKTIASVGAVTAPTVEHMDAVLRRLAAATAAHAGPMPALAALAAVRTASGSMSMTISSTAAVTAYLAIIALALGDQERGRAAACPGYCRYSLNGNWQSCLRRKPTRRFCSSLRMWNISTSSV